jgi:hypothetical protein
MAATSSRVLPHVTAKPERHSSHLNRSVRDPSGSGSAEIMTWARTGVDEMVVRFSFIALRHRHAGHRSGIQRASVREPLNPYQASG